MKSEISNDNVAENSSKEVLGIVLPPVFKPSPAPTNEPSLKATSSQPTFQPSFRSSETSVPTTANSFASLQPSQKPATGVNGLLTTRNIEYGVGGTLATVLLAILAYCGFRRYRRQPAQALETNTNNYSNLPDGEVNIELTSHNAANTNPFENVEDSRPLIKKEEESKESFWNRLWPFPSSGKPADPSFSMTDNTDETEEKVTYRRSLSSEGLKARGESHMNEQPKLRKTETSNENLNDLDDKKGNKPSSILSARSGKSLSLRQKNPNDSEITI